MLPVNENEASRTHFLSNFKASLKIRAEWLYPSAGEQKGRTDQEETSGLGSNLIKKVKERERKEDV